VLRADPDDPWLSQHVPALKGMGLIEGKAAAYVCHHFTCELPVTTSAELLGRLEAAGQGGGI
jgi:uncharacterized protein